MSPRASHAAPRRVRRGDALGAWAGSWRVAIRTAWRDARRHRGISAMIMIMVGLPVLIICAGGTVISTSTVTYDEQLSYRLGRTDALVRIASGKPVQQRQQGLYADSDTPPTHRYTEADVAKAVDGNAYEITTGVAQIPATALGETGRPISARVLGLTDAGLHSTGLVRLRRGDWPTTPGEVLVSRALARRGIAIGDTLSLARLGADDPQTYTVSGIADARTENGGFFDLVTTDHRLAPSTVGLGGDAQQFLITADQPVDWAMITKLNQRGWLVQSRLAVTDPEAAGVPPTERESTSYTFPLPVFAAGIFAALMLETMLLAGPAFAISAIRRRRALALLATSGATAKQVRRVTLAQGLVLGALAAPIGAVLGIGGVALVRAIVDWWTPGSFLPAAFQVSGLLVAGTIVAAAVSSVVAALIPARGAKRLDIAAALTDRAPERRVVAHRVLALVALVITAALAVNSITGLVHSRPHQFTLTMTLAIATILTGVLAVGLLADLLGVLPGPGTAARLALRDLSRHRPRTVPILAAVLATSAAMSLLNVALATTDAQDAASYTPRAQLGQLVGSGDIATFTDEVRRQHPDWLIDQLYDVKHGLGLVVALPRCQNSEGNLDRSGCVNSFTGVAIRPATSWPYGNPGADALAALQEGTVLVPDARMVHDGRVTLTITNYKNSESRTITAPGLAIDPALMGGSSGTLFTGWMLPDTARSLGLDIEVVGAIARAPHGKITSAQAAAIAERLPTAPYLEQGYRSGVYAILRAVLLGVGAALVLLAITVGTGLGRAEGAADRATLAAVGGTPALTRRMAAWSTGTLCVIGMLAGLVVGVPGGVAIARAMIYPWFVGRLGPVVPYADLALMTGAALVLAVAIAVITTRTRTTLTRRLG